MGIYITRKEGHFSSLTRYYAVPAVLAFRNGPAKEVVDVVPDPKEGTDGSKTEKGSEASVTEMGLPETIGRRFVAEIGLCALWLVALAEHVGRFVLFTGLAPILLLVELIICDVDDTPVDLLIAGLIVAPANALDHTILTPILLFRNIFEPHMKSDNDYLLCKLMKQ